MAQTPDAPPGMSHWIWGMEDGPLRAVSWWRRPGKRLFVSVTILEALQLHW